MAARRRMCATADPIAGVRPPVAESSSAGLVAGDGMQVPVGAPSIPLFLSPPSGVQV
jgi:hypothetical protein